MRFFYCKECDMGKYVDENNTFTEDDQFYCYRCQGYTDNRVE